MKVQRVRLPETNGISWFVLDDDYIPIQPVFAYLRFLHDLDRSPNTIRNAAHHLKLFWEYLRDARLDWKEVDVAQLSAFIIWLRQQGSAVLSIEPKPAGRSNATIDQSLSTVHGFYDFHMRMKTIEHIPLYRMLMLPNRRYKPFLYGITRTKPVQTRIISLPRDRRSPKTLTSEQVQTLLGACSHLRDRFLLHLLYDTGIRVGQALGLRHEDINIENGEIHIVPRDDNTNGARAKTREAYTIPAMMPLMQLYTDYLIEDLGALEADALPDYVFVNLWEGTIGGPMTYETVMSLVHRLRKQTKIYFTPHMFRHTRATLWIREDNLPLATVSRLLGHTQIQTTQAIYVHLTSEDLKKALTEGKRRMHHADEQ
jgi:integrase/recombinase XerD